MESFENWHEHSPWDPQELSLLHNCSKMPLNPKTFDTNFPAGRQGMGRNGHYAQLAAPSQIILHLWVLLDLTKIHGHLPKRLLPNGLLPIFSFWQTFTKCTFTKKTENSNVKTFTKFWQTFTKSTYACLGQLACPRKSQFRPLGAARLP